MVCVLTELQTNFTADRM